MVTAFDFSVLVLRVNVTALCQNLCYSVACGGKFLSGVPPYMLCISNMELSFNYKSK